MSEESWFLGVKIKDYIDAVILRSEEKETVIGEEQGGEHSPKPIIHVIGKPYGLKIKCSPSSVGSVIDKLLSSDNTIVDEIYVRNSGDKYVISALLYVEKTIDLWKIIDQLVEAKEINDVNIVRTIHGETTILPNPWLFPIRINGLTLSLIPITILCSISVEEAHKWVQELADNVFSDFRGKIDPYLIPALLKTFGFGEIKGEEYIDKKYIFKISCGSDEIDEGYCVFIGKLIDELLNHGHKIRWENTGSECIVELTMQE